MLEFNFFYGPTILVMEKGIGTMMEMDPLPKGEGLLYVHFGISPQKVSVLIRDLGRVRARL